MGLGLHIEPGVRRALLESSRWLATGMLCLTSYMAENGAEQGSTRVKGPGRARLMLMSCGSANNDVVVFFVIRTILTVYCNLKLEQ